MKAMNDTIIQRCKELPKGESIYGCPADPNEVHGTLLTTDHIIHLATELERIENECKRIYVTCAGSSEQIADEFIKFVHENFPPK